MFKLLIYLQLASMLNCLVLNREDFLLPSNLLPLKYALELTIFEDGFYRQEFFGKLNITLQSRGTTNTLEFHQKYLEIEHSRLLDANNEEILFKSTYDEETEICMYSTERPLKFGETYTLYFDYVGFFNDTSMHGFYLASYKEKVPKDNEDITDDDFADMDNEIRYVASTYLESTHAREVFPCFDEPRFKAPLILTVHHPKQYNVISNTPSTIIVGQNPGDLTCTKFEETPPMPTYLYAFVVSEFDSTEGRLIASAPKAIKSRVWSRPEAMSTRKLAANETTRLLESLGRITGIPYEQFNEITAKMDQVAIPDFSAGAMENWALVTYRERTLLWDETHSSDRYKQSVLQTIAHELTHHWFGNLVTLEWWSAVFLNEGFANFFGYHALHRAGAEETSQIEDYKTWEMDKQYVIEEVQDALDFDSQNTSLALYSPHIYSPQQVSSHFGTISYSKGGSILRMFENYLTEDVFNKGLTNYLNTFKYKNARHTDLWDKLGINQTIAKEWTERPGYPLLTVRLDGNNVNISQKRFLTVGIDNLKTKWYVPISFANSKDSNFDDTTFTHLLTPEKDLVIENAVQNNGWIVLNKQHKGYYRVEYDDALWQRLQAGLEKENFDGIPELNRAQIVDDTFNLVRAGKLTYVDVIQRLRFLKNDISLYPWHAALDGFTFLLKRIDDETEKPLKSAITNVLSDWLKKVYEQFSNFTPQTKHIDSIKQILIVTKACSLGFENCTTNALNLFEKHILNTTNYLDRNLRGIIYCEGLRHSKDPEKNFKLFLEKFTETNLSTEQLTILNAIGCIKNPFYLKLYLRELFSEDTGIRRQDINTVLNSVFTNNNEGVFASIEFLDESLKEFQSKYGNSTVKTLLNNIYDRITNKEQLEKLDIMKTKLDDKTIISDINRGILRANSNLANSKLWKDQLLAHFKLNDKGSGAMITFNYAIMLLPVLISLIKF